MCPLSHPCLALLDITVSFPLLARGIMHSIVTQLVVVMACRAEGQVLCSSMHRRREEFTSYTLFWMLLHKWIRSSEPFFPEATTQHPPPFAQQPPSTANTRTFATAIPSEVHSLIYYVCFCRGRCRRVFVDVHMLGGMI